MQKVFQIASSWHSGTSNSFNPALFSRLNEIKSDQSQAKENPENKNDEIRSTGIIWILDCFLMANVKT